MIRKYAKCSERRIGVHVAPKLTDIYLDRDTGEVHMFVIHSDKYTGEALVSEYSVSEKYLLSRVIGNGE